MLTEIKSIPTLIAQSTAKIDSVYLDVFCTLKLIFIVLKATVNMAYKV